MYPYRLDTNVKVAFDAQFVLPVLFPFLPGVLPDENHVGELGHRLIAPFPGYFLEASAYFSEYSL